MSSVNDLLRFLAQDAKIPLSLAMSKVKLLQKADLTDPSKISKSDIKTLHTIFSDERFAKQALNAAKKHTKKRPADIPADTTAKKLRKMSPESNPVHFEESLKLPSPCLDESSLSKTAILVNRAPLLLAFAVVLLERTMPDQPLSSRLSLAQALVSKTSRSKASSLGISNGKGTEDESWLQGQPSVLVMGREIHVMKRHRLCATSLQVDSISPNDEDGSHSESSGRDEFALWGLDLSATSTTNTTDLPIHTAQSARAYLLKSFDSPPGLDSSNRKAGEKKVAVGKAAEKEQNLSSVLGAIQLLMNSWSPTLSNTDLDRRAWSSYVQIRPDVESGVAGWGKKNIIELSSILDLRRR